MSAKKWLLASVKFVTTFLAVLVIGVFLVLIWLYLSGPHDRVQKKDFDQIMIGMQVDEVEAIMGRGRILRIGQPAESDTRETWQTVGKVRWISVGYKNGKVVSKVYRDHDKGTREERPVPSQ